MKISVAQTSPVKGDILHNLECHYKLIQLGLAHDIDVIIFPEMSVTGYEPELAEKLAANENDDIFDHLQELSDKFGVTIGVGMPKKLDSGISISTILLQPRQIRHVYLKKYLHHSEMPHFTANEDFKGLIGPQGNIALGICYEMSIPDHFEDISSLGASYYINSSVKDHESIERSYKRLSEVANQYNFITLLSNVTGKTGNYECPGRSAIWDENGILIKSLNETDEGVLIYDTESKTAEAFYLNQRRG